MNWQRHEKALKETIEDIKDLIKIFLIITIVIVAMLLLIYLSTHYPLVGIPLSFLSLFLLLYYANFRRN